MKNKTIPFGVVYSVNVAISASRHRDVNRMYMLPIVYVRDSSY